MRAKSATRFENLDYCAKDGMLTLQNWLTISGKLVAVLDQSLKDVTFTAAKNQARCNRVSLDKVHLTNRFQNFNNI